MGSNIYAGHVNRATRRKRLSVRDSAFTSDAGETIVRLGGGAPENSLRNTPDAEGTPVTAHALLRGILSNPEHEHPPVRTSSFLTEKHPEDKAAERHAAIAAIGLERLASRKERAEKHILQECASFRCAISSTQRL